MELKIVFVFFEENMSIAGSDIARYPIHTHTLTHMTHNRHSSPFDEDDGWKRNERIFIWNAKIPSHSLLDSDKIVIHRHSINLSLFSLPRMAFICSLFHSNEMSAHICLLLLLLLLSREWKSNRKFFLISQSIFVSCWPPTVWWLLAARIAIDTNVRQWLWQNVCVCGGDNPIHERKERRRTKETKKKYPKIETIEIENNKT